RGDPSKSIYELISSNKHTTRFAKLVDAHTDIKALLSDTSAGNVTLFVPTDRAFERLPKHDGHDGHGDDDDDDDDDDDKKPPAEFVRALLAYHIVPGRFPLRRLKGQQTVGTNLSLSSLGSRPQRVRVSRSAIPFFGPAARLNFYSRVVFGDVVAANGVVHAVDAILVPPPRQAKIVQLLPGTFSTLALALETTGDDDDAPPRTGGTLFAPTNHAFARLGTRTNAFLFSERGKKYLRALLKYHIVANETLYSDAFYKKKTDYDHDHDHADKNTDSASRDYWHVDLPSQLHGKPISVDIKRWFHVVSIKVNGLVNVVVKDGIAHDGVIHVVDKVLIPQHHRHHPHGDGEDDDDAVGLDELKARLEPYLEEDESVGRVDGGYEDL
ncbi:Fasciclin domain-containing protein, partial [Lasiosphaeria ovina]